MTHVNPCDSLTAGQVLGQAQLTLNIQQQHQHTATGGVGQRGRQMYPGVSRAVSTSSPASAAVVSSGETTHRNTGKLSWNKSPGSKQFQIF